MDVENSPCEYRTDYIAWVSGDGEIKEVNFPPEYMFATGIPRGIRQINKFNHGGCVCTVAVSSTAEFVFTGGKGCVKVWDSYLPADSRPVSELECFCLPDKKFVRAMKIMSDNIMVVGGESNKITVWDLKEASPRKIGDFSVASSETHALAINDDSKVCFSGGSDGVVTMWDVHNRKLIRELHGHVKGAECLDITRDGSRLWTGGLDQTLRCWDIGSGKELMIQDFESPVFSVSCHPDPGTAFVAIGLGDRSVEIQHDGTQEKYISSLHECAVLSVKFSSSGRWLLSTGRDSLVNGWRVPYGINIFQKKELSLVYSCDISRDDMTIVTGSGNNVATAYRVLY